jgi:Heparinase II/III-like protein
VLTVDGEDFDWRGAEPYGSGIEAAGEEDGWYTVSMRNPLLAAQGVDHRRVLLYRPAEALIVLDDVQSANEHDYVRRFHFGSGLEAAQNEPGRVALAGKSIAATLTDIGDEAELALDRSREDPRLGWTYPGDRERTAVWTATLRSRAKNATLATVLTLGDNAIEVTISAIKSDHIEIQLGASTVTVRS